MILRYVKYVTGTGLALGFTYLALGGPMWGLTPTLIVLAVLSSTVVAMIRVRRKSGEDWRLLEKGFGDSLVKIIEPDGAAVAFLVMRFGIGSG